MIGPTAKILNGWDILAEMRSRGLRVYEGKGDRVMVGPRELIQDRDRATVAEHRQLILAVLRWEAHPTIAAAIEKLDGRIVDIKEELS